MSHQSAERYALVAAGVMIVALTAGGFWLSYAHLAEVAGQHGLGDSPVRQWAWPASLDAAIIAGELLMLRAGFRKTVDWWAVTLTSSGSVGSIALNIAGVSSTQHAGAVPVLDYVVAAVPPTAALVAFGVLMRQIHQLVTTPSPTATGHQPAAGACITHDAVPRPGTAEAQTLPLAQTNADTGTGPEPDLGAADQTADTPANQGGTGTSTTDQTVPVHRTDTTDHAAADHTDLGGPTRGGGTGTSAEADQTLAAPRTNAADHAAADQATNDTRTSISAGRTVTAAADHDRTAEAHAPGAAAGSDTDQTGPPADQRSGPADERTNPPAGLQTGAADHAAADQVVTARSTDPVRQQIPDQTNATADHPRTTTADQNATAEDEPMPMEQLVEIARNAALAEGRMTRRVLRPYLRAQDIQISNERFSTLQTLLQQDPALAHLPRPPRKAR
ncbi:DUF2637 domain-containing protein [Streptomyces sp. NPDC055078]